MDNRMIDVSELIGGGVVKGVDLKPCPFCGGIAEMLKIDVNEYFVMCTNASCGVAQALSWKSKKTATTKWNRRRGEANER